MHLVARPAVTTLSNLSGSRFDYGYGRLRVINDDEALAAYARRARTLFAPIARAFDNARNTEWALRSYLALKLILHATVTAASARYASDRNLHAAVPYLTYYTLFSACRAFLLTCPEVKWSGANSARFSHGKARTLSSDLLKRLDPKVAEQASEVLLSARRQRELFSYAFPMSGPRGPGGCLVSVEEAIVWSGVFAELAHLNSACLEGSVAKHCLGLTFGLNDDDAWALMHHEMEGGKAYFDECDWKWLARLFSRHEVPVALSALVTEGMIEDFFGAWSDPEQTKHAFDPDQDWEVLLDLW